MKIYNTLTRKKEKFVPIDSDNVGMYVCGPTVYNRPHVGNARAVVVYDVLYRLLKSIYPKVTFVRNITDVDDKINAAAKENGESISSLADRVTRWFHEDMAELNNLLPDIEPRATEHIPEIISLIERIVENGYGYENDGHILFDIEGFSTTSTSGWGEKINSSNVGVEGSYYYGKLSGKKLKDLIAGARIAVEDYKRNAGDFVLWKPSANDEPRWDSPWGYGRPGWHIECSAMSVKYLGENFDIHGGGADLKFPHHENEIAQSIAGNKGSHFVNYWIHNGFLTVNGEKMSKSLGNFTTVKELLDRGVKGEVIRYVLLSTHYRKPLDFNDKALERAEKNLDVLYGAVKSYKENTDFESDENVSKSIQLRSENAYIAFKEALHDDLNTPKALAELYVMAKGLRSVNSSTELLKQFMECAGLLGILSCNPEEWFFEDNSDLDVEKIENLILLRAEAKKMQDWCKADKIRDELTDIGVMLEDSSEGTTWNRKK